MDSLVLTSYLFHLDRVLLYKEYKTSKGEILRVFTKS